MPTLSPLALKAYLSGGATNPDGNLSLGGARSTKQLWPQGAETTVPAPPFTIVGAFGHTSAGIGAGTLSYVATGDLLTWTPAGGAPGTAITLANDGADKFVTDASDEAGLVFTDNASMPGTDTSWTITVTEPKNLLFDNIRVAELTSGHTDVRCVFVTPDGQWTDAKIYLSAQPPSGVTIEIGLDPTAVNTSGTDAATVADEETLPAGVTFSSPTTEGTAIDIGTVNADNDVAIWIKRTSAPGQAQSLDDGVGLVFVGTVGAAASGRTSSRWRILVNSSRHAQNVSIAELEFRNTVGGTRVTGATATSNGTRASASGDPERVQDGNIATFWANADSEYPVWVELTWPSDQTFIEMSVSIRSDADADQGPRDWKGQYHDGTGWIDFYSNTDEPVWSLGETRAFSTLPKPEWWRLNMREGTTDGYFAVTEVEFRTQVGVAEPGNAATAFSSSVYTLSGPYPPDGAFDGSLGPNDFFASAPNDPLPQRVGTRFPGGRLPKELAIYTTSPNFLPTEFDIQYSFDSTTGLDGNWVTLDALSLPTPAADIWVTFILSDL